MNILVIGSKGFIGNHVYTYLKSNTSFTVHACDVVVDYTNSNYFLLDATNSNYNEIFEYKPFDFCINCGGAASVPDSVIHPLRDFTLNVNNVFKILDAIKKHAAQCRFINLSSAAVYGSPGQLPIKETDECLPISPYGIHKYFAEQICREYYQFYQVQSCSLRIFSAYGPGLKKQLLWDLFQKSKHSDNILLFGTGKETRDFIYIDDIVQSIELILHAGEFNAAVYNVANGEEVRITDIAFLLLKELNYKGNYSFSGEQRPGDPLAWKADVQKIQALGYIQKVTVEQGIIKYVKWLREKKSD